MVRLLRATGREVNDRTVLEIGSGWFPVIPIIYAVLGARRVIMSDLRRYMDNQTFCAACDFVSRNADQIGEALHVEPADIRGLLDQASSPGDLGLDYQVPFDPRRQSSGSVDLITSRTVLEHIPENIMGGLLAEWARLLSDDGVMVHAIDMSDHFEHADKTISRINFLRFNERTWGWINAVTDHQNRLRHSEYLALFVSVGLDTLAIEAHVNDRAREDATRLKLAARFNRMSPDDLATLTSYLVLKPSPLNLRKPPPGGQSPGLAEAE